MMFACDTFRLEALEQLPPHARSLQIPIFEKGYEKYPAIVAKEQIQETTRNGSDVVLIDTAGRMHVKAKLGMVYYYLKKLVDSLITGMSSIHLPNFPMASEIYTHG